MRGPRSAATAAASAPTGRSSELRKIATALLGTVDIVPDPAGLAADFRQMMAAAMGKEVADVLLRRVDPAEAPVAFVKQVAPTDRGPDRPAGAGRRADRRLPDRRVGPTSPATTTWHPGDAAGVGQEMLAARVSLVAAPAGSRCSAQGLVRAMWTDD